MAVHEQQIAAVLVVEQSQLVKQATEQITAKRFIMVYVSYLYEETGPCLQIRRRTKECVHRTAMARVPVQIDSGFQTLFIAVRSEAEEARHCS